MSFSRFITVVLTTSLFLSGCSFVDRWVYRPDINQGNYVTQDAVDQLAIGQTKEQVNYIMGTPMLTSTFGDDVWYYIFSEKPQHGYVRQQTYTIKFAQDKVIDIQKSAYDRAKTPTDNE